MADISRIKLPSGTVYEIKDAVDRAQLGGAIMVKGTTTTALTDEATTNPIQLDGSSYTAVANDAVFYNKKEFIFDGTKWHEFGDMSGLGALATKDSVSASYTPTGSVATPTITLDNAGSTTNIKNPTAATVVTSVSAAAPGTTAPSNAMTYYSVADETLTLYQIGYSTGDSITTENVTVKTGDASYTASAPAFTGTAATITST